MSEPTPPKVFISYSWTNQSHEDWVLRLATSLVQSGIDVVFDKWDLPPGEDAGHFMERMVNDPSISKVIMVCDKEYKRRADARVKGAGIEAQILSPELYKGTVNAKFCAIVTEIDDQEKAPTPTYYSSRIYIDFSDEARWVEKHEELVRWIFNKPALVKPQLGSSPSYLRDDQAENVLGTTICARRALDALRNHRAYWKESVQEYFQTTTLRFEQLRLQPSAQYVSDFQRCIESFRPCRNEVVAVVSTLASSPHAAAGAEMVHRFFESLLPYTLVQNGRLHWMTHEFDNYAFIIHELFKLSIASLVKNEHFDFAGNLTRDEYVFEKPGSTRAAAPFTVFQTLSSQTAEAIYNNSHIRYTSPRAHLLISRLEGSSLTSVDVAQADLMLALRAKLIKEIWWPETIIHTEIKSPLPVFVRSKSVRYYERVKAFMRVDATQLRGVIDEIDFAGGFFGSRSPFHMSVSDMTKAKSIATVAL